MLAVGTLEQNLLHPQIQWYRKLRWWQKWMILPLCRWVSRQHINYTLEQDSRSPFGNVTVHPRLTSLYRFVVLHANLQGTASIELRNRVETDTHNECHQSKDEKRDIWKSDKLFYKSWGQFGLSCKTSETRAYHMRFVTCFLESGLRLKWVEESK